MLILLCWWGKGVALKYQVINVEKAHDYCTSISILGNLKTACEKCTLT